MTNIRLFAAIAVSVVLTALVMGAITRPAHADTPRTPVCVWRVPGAPVSVSSEKTLDQQNAAVQAWMASQTAEGRVQFMLVPSTLPGRDSICAW